MKKILFSDIDGTIAKDNLPITYKDQEAVKKLRTQGHYFSFCTGRNIQETKLVTPYFEYDYLCLVTTLKPSTITLPSFGLTATTLPVFLPLDLSFGSLYRYSSLPVSRTTVSPVFTCTLLILTPPPYSTSGARLRIFM